MHMGGTGSLPAAQLPPAAGRGPPHPPHPAQQALTTGVSDRHSPGRQSQTHGSRATGLHGRGPAPPRPAPKLSQRGRHGALSTTLSRSRGGSRGAGGDWPGRRRHRTEQTDAASWPGHPPRAAQNRPCGTRGAGCGCRRPWGRRALCAGRGRSRFHADAPDAVSPGSGSSRSARRCSRPPGSPPFPETGPARTQSDAGGDAGTPLLGGWGLAARDTCCLARCLRAVGTKTPSSARFSEQEPLPPSPDWVCQQ